MPMKHASLFSGIGGFDLAAHWMGWENIFQVEIDPFCQKVLAKNFTTVTRYGDIKEFDGTKYRGAIDILTGGFPCQPYSLSGKRKGNEDSRHLWPEMLRVIGEIQPSFVVGENVYGLINWSEGLVFKQVQTDLEGLGYTVAPVILPACGVDAPHKRDRIWFVAYTSREGVRATTGRINKSRELLQASEWKESKLVNKCAGNSWSSADTYTQGLQIRVQSGQRCNVKAYGAFTRSKLTRTPSTPGWSQFPTQSGIRRRNDGISNRVDRIKSLGNAIVPQVAKRVFRAIEEINLIKV
jgi:DNA (cytosine-5)-methyltransferase 1